MMKIFFWVKDEWSCLEWTKKWADKLWHFLGSWVLTMVLGVVFKTSIIRSGSYSLLAGIVGWEWIVDCVIFRHGASRLDILADILGTICGMITLWLGGWIWL